MKKHGPDTWQTDFGQVTCWADLGMSVCALCVCVWGDMMGKGIENTLLQHWPFITEHHPQDRQPSFRSQIDNPYKPPDHLSTISDFVGGQAGCDLLIWYGGRRLARWLERFYLKMPSKFAIVWFKPCYNVCWSQYLMILNSICSTCANLGPLFDCCSFRG